MRPRVNISAELYSLGGPMILQFVCAGGAIKKDALRVPLCDKGIYLCSQLIDLPLVNWALFGHE